MLLGRNTNPVRKRMCAPLVTCRAMKTLQTMKPSLVSILFVDLQAKPLTITVQSLALPSTFKVLNKVNEPSTVRLSFIKVEMLYKTAVFGTVKR